jgi:hypothetical protein
MHFSEVVALLRDLADMLDDVVGDDDVEAIIRKRQLGTVDAGESESVCD